MLKMMLRELARSFVVVALLVSVTSAQGCCVCGDGNQVGSPSAITTFRRFPEQTDTQCTCSDLEFAGLEGLISNKECSALPILIFETCDCQKNGTSILSTNAYIHSLRGSGYSSPRRAQQSWFAPSALGTSPPVSAPFFTPTTPGLSAPFLYFSPLSLPTSDPISYTYRPTYYRTPAAAPTQDPNTQLLIAVVTVVAALGLLGVIRCSIALTNASPRNERQILATPTNLPVIPVSTPMQLKEQTLARRPLVLAVLFPDEGKVSSVMRRAPAFFPTCLSTSDF
jgi:hypothetical protein